jgi:hypothetical protein
MLRFGKNLLNPQIERGGGYIGPKSLKNLHEEPLYIGPKSVKNLHQEPLYRYKIAQKPAFKNPSEAPKIA